MSILAQVSLRPLLDGAAALFFVGGPILSLWIGLRLSVLQPRTVLGPQRLADDDSLLSMLGILMLGLLCWILIPQFYAAALHRRGAATQPALNFSPSELVVLTALAQAAAFGLMCVAHATTRPGRLRGLGLSLAGVGRASLPALAGLVFLLPLLSWVNLLTMQLWKLLGQEHPVKHDFLEILDKSPSRWLSVLLVFSACVIAPLFEELLFRGHLQTLLGDLFAGKHRTNPRRVGPETGETELPAARPERVSEPAGADGAAVPLEYPRPRSSEPHEARARGMAIVVTSLAFAAVHPWWTTPPIFFLALCLGYAYERTGNLLVPILMHALFNTISVILSLLLPQ